MLRSTPPRRIAMRHWQEPILLALMFDPIIARCEAVAFETPPELVNVWSPATSGPVHMSARSAQGNSEETSSESPVHPLNNEAARWAVAKGTSDSPTLASIARVYQAFELLQPSVTWFERVASFSNPADAPSRHQVQQAVDVFGAQAVSPVSMEAEVQALLQLSTDPLVVINLRLS